MMPGLALSLLLPLVAAADETPPLPTTGDTAGRHLVVILFPKVDLRAQAPDMAKWPGMLQSELQTAAKNADVLLVADAASNAKVVDPIVVACMDVACAPNAGTAVRAK